MRRCFTCAAVWIWNRQNPVLAHASSKRVLPWSALIQPGRQAHMIFCDPEIVTIQRMLNFTVTLSDYANRQYWPDPASMSPEAGPHHADGGFSRNQRGGRGCRDRAENREPGGSEYG